MEIDYPYSELHAHSWYSFLDGTASPEALAQAAAQLGYGACAITDHDGVYGAVRFWQAAREHGLKPVIGAEITLEDESHLTLLAETQAGYTNLCRLITASRHAPADVQPWPGKLPPRLPWTALHAHSAGIIALSGCAHGPLAQALAQPEGGERALEKAAQLRDIFGADNFFIELQRLLLPGEKPRNDALRHIAQVLALDVVATGNVHLLETPVDNPLGHPLGSPTNKRLRDCFTAIRHQATLAEAAQRGLLPVNGNAVLRSPQAMAALWADVPQAVRNSGLIAARCNASLDFSARRAPAFPAPDGESTFGYLYRLCHAALPRCYPDLRPAVLKQLSHELEVIDKTGLADYFLTVWDIVQFAKREGIRCQGRGSACGSIVSYLLGIAITEPLKAGLLFERFLSEDRLTPPDIDLDFASAHEDERERVIQYVYARYGHAHCAMVCNTITYHARGALRDIGKALGFPEAALGRLSVHSDDHDGARAAEALRALVPVSEQARANHPVLHLADLVQAAVGAPRHLGIHSGGMLISGPPLHELVPVEPATMPGRYVVQWDKYSVEDCGQSKIDLLGLRALSLLSEAARVITADEGADAVQAMERPSYDDPMVYDLICSGKTIGLFQVESRAQIQFLPRHQPRNFEDLTAQVAIIRPGPIQGNATHPYLRRRAGEETVVYPHPSLAKALHPTLGVILYQETAMRVAMEAAGFSGAEADRLRRLLAREQVDDAMRQRFMDGALARGFTQITAEQTWAMVSAFSGYGFPKSHAAAFASITYQTGWLKTYYPAVLYAAFINSGPMGFYSDEVLLGDARRWGLKLRPVDINRSQWDYTLEGDGPLGRRDIRVGLRAVNGFGSGHWQAVQAARAVAPFADVRALALRAHLPLPALMALVRAGACDGFGPRRQLLWALGELDAREGLLDLQAEVTAANLPALSSLQHTQWDYALTGFSPDTHIMAHYRAHLRALGCISTAEVRAANEGDYLRVGGLVVMKQRPQTAKGITFISLEDETGLLDIVVKPQLREKHKLALRSGFLIFEGTLQRAHGSLSLLAGAIAAVEA